MTEDVSKQLFKIGNQIVVKRHKQNGGTEKCMIRWQHICSYLLTISCYFDEIHSIMKCEKLLKVVALENDFFTKSDVPSSWSGNVSADSNRRVHLPVPDDDMTSRIDIRTIHPRKSAESVSETRMWLTGSIGSGAGEDDESQRELLERVPAVNRHSIHPPCWELYDPQ